MLAIILWIVMFVLGIVTLVTGTINVSRKKVARGAPARIAGVILLLPFPLSLILGIVVGLAMGASGNVPQGGSLLALGVALELGPIILCFIGAMLVAGLNAVPKDEPARRRRPDDEGDYEDEDAGRAYRKPDDRIRRRPDDRIQE